MMAQVTTFYSYKGGSGRSMTMANVAWALATNGERVLAIDWDLEAPGLHRYFHPFLSDPEQASTPGLMDRIWDYIDQVSIADPAIDRFALANCENLVQQLDLPIRSVRKRKGCLHLLGAGRQDEQYSEKVGGLDWANFYERFDGRGFIDRLMGWARENYTHILIDSRTGVADTAGICTAQLPDALVLCLVYNRQSIEGSAAVARSIVQTREKLGLPRPNIFILPCRVEERSVVDSARRYAARQISKALRSERLQMERVLRRDEIRHYPWCAFEEKLAVFEEVADERGSMLDATHEMARRLSGNKALKIVEIEPGLLASIWRRAAFDDPRIADLETLNERTTESAQEQILIWLDEAVSSREERPDWLMALGEVAVRSAAGPREHGFRSAREALATMGLRVADRAYDADPQQYGTRFALLLQMRAAQLQKLRDYDQALALGERAAQIFGRDRHSVSRNRQARALERVAEIRLAMGDYLAAVQAQHEAVDLYRSFGRRARPIGGEVDAARATRTLAEMLYVRGDTSAALDLTDEAVKLLYGAGATMLSRNAGEVLRVITKRAEIMAQIDFDQTASEITRARIMGGQILGASDQIATLELRLRRIEAEALIRHGSPVEALAKLRAIDLAEASPVERAEVIELMASALVDSGQVSEAVELLKDAMKDTDLPLVEAMPNLLRRALKASGREVDMTQILLERLLRQEPTGSVQMSELLRLLNDDDWNRLAKATPNKSSPSNTQ